MVPRTFFEREPLICARELIGCEVVCGPCSGTIVETEAYTLTGDPACHTFLRASVRQFIAEQAPGTAYVYLNYGIHWLLNVLVKGGTMDGFVLIRALEPHRGLEEMAERRRQSVPKLFCSGPGKLTQALGITGADHRTDLCGEGRVHFEAAMDVVEVLADVRIGISRAQDFPWRFFMRGSLWVSVRATDASRPV